MNSDYKPNLGQLDLVYWVYRSSYKCLCSCAASWMSLPRGCLFFLSHSHIPEWITILSRLTPGPRTKSTHEGDRYRCSDSRTSGHTDTQTDGHMDTDR